MDLRARVLGYVPGYTLPNANHGIQRVLLQVFGMAGHGKSALINSCLCVVRNQRYQNLAPSGPSHQEMTVTRREYELTPHLIMIDNRGLNKLNKEEELEISAQFRHLRGLGEVTWSEQNLSESLRHFKQQQGTGLKDLIVPVFVYSAERPWNKRDGDDIKKIIINAHQITGSLWNIGEVEWYKDVLEETLRLFPPLYQKRPADFLLPVLGFRAAKTWNTGDAENLQTLIINIFKITGIHPVAVITECTNENFKTIQEKFGELGVTRRLSVENYTENNNTRTKEKDQRILEFVHVCIKEAERAMKIKENHNNQIRFVSQAVEQIKLETDLLKEILTT